MVEPIKRFAWIKQRLFLEFLSGELSFGTTIFRDIVTPHKENLLLPQKPEELHRLWPKLTLLIGKIPGKYS